MKVLLTVTLSQTGTISSSTLIGLALGFVFSFFGIFIQQFYLERAEKKRKLQKIREESILVMSKTFTKMIQPYKMYKYFNPNLTLNLDEYFENIRNPLFAMFHKLPMDISNKLYALDQKVNIYEQLITEASVDLENDGYLNELNQQEAYVESLSNEDYGYFPSRDPNIEKVMDPKVIDILREEYLNGLIFEEENIKEIRALEKALKEVLKKEIEKYREEIYK